MTYTATSPGSGISRQHTVLCLLVILLFTAVVRMPLLQIPFERDEGEYAYIAWRMGHNELPYRDWVNQKPPGVFWVYQAALSLPFQPVGSVHFVAFLFSAASAAALFFLAQRLLRWPYALIAAVLFAVLSADPLVQGTAANTEIFMLLPLILSQLAFFEAGEGERPRRIAYALLCGILTGAAVAFKQVAAVNWVFLAAVYPLLVRHNRVRQTVRFAVWTAVGVGLVWVLIGMYFGLRDVLKDMIYSVFTHNFEYVQAASWPQRWQYCLETLAVLARSQTVVWIASVAALVLLWLRRRHWFYYLGGWAVTSMIGVSASGYFFPHYFQQLLPALAIAAAYTAENAAEASWAGAIPAAVRRAVVILLLAVLPAITFWPFLFVYSPADAVRKIYPRDVFAEMPAVAGRIAQLAGPDDRVFIFGAEPEVLFYSRRISATRYIFLFPLYGPYRHARENQIATSNEIAANRPAAVFYLPNRMFFAAGTEQYFTEWTQSYLDEHYRNDTLLTVDNSRNIEFLFTEGAVPPLEPGKRVFGRILARKQQ